MRERRESLLFVAGEASGDLHGSKVVASLGSIAPDLRVYGVGGDRMRQAGAELTHHVRDFAMIGFAEVVRHVPRLKAAMDDILDQVAQRGTRAAVLIDYPGFNLALARRLRAVGVRVLYYISPQVWAWGEGRVRKIARVTDRVAVILPFEKEFYARRGVSVEFVGHPLMEEPEVARPRGPRTSISEPPLLGLLPGSRRQEIERHLPVMAGAASILEARLGSLSVRVGTAEAADPSVLAGMLAAAGRPQEEVLDPGETHRLMRDASALLVASGTATLEAACFGTPMVVVYKMSPLTHMLGRYLVKIPHIGLVNVVAGRKVVPELIQNSATPERMADAVVPYLTDADLAARTSSELLAVRNALGEPGASDRVARMALELAGVDV